jgi:CelD/BcsL family acetyltransferase involved in cellulose biosynthesis
MSNSISVTRLDDFEAIGATEWNHLVGNSATGTVFQTYQWQRAWWQTFGDDARELLLLAAREHSQLVGIVALYLDQARVLRLVGHGKSDYADFLCAADREDVRAALWQRIVAEQGSWKRFELRHLPLTSPTAAQLDSLNVDVLRNSTVSCPTLLIDGHAEFFAKVRKKKSLRRHHNYFRKQGDYQVEHLRQAGQILPHLDHFFQQHINRWAAIGQPSLFSDKINRRFYRAVAEHFDHTGWLCFTRLSMEEQPIAFHFGFVFNRTFIWYKPSFETDLARHSPGEALIWELFELAAVEELAEFDFTVGDEAFKKRLANHIRHNQTITLYASSLEYRIQQALRDTKQYVRSSRLGRPLFDLSKRLLRRS